MQALPLNFARLKLPARKVSPTAGSLPIAMNKPRQSAMSWALAHKDPVSKSWSDLWDEEEEEAEEEAKQLETLKEKNSRTWSHESNTEVNDNSAIDNDDTPRQGLSPAVKHASLHLEDDSPSIAAAISDDIDQDLISDGFFFHDAPPAKKGSQQPLAPYSPPSKRDNFDKWAALGEKRRAVAGGKYHDSSVVPRHAWPKSPETAFKLENRVDKQHSPSFFASMAGQHHGVSDLGTHHNLAPQHYLHSSLPLGNAHNHSLVHSNHTPNTINNHNNLKWTTPHKDVAAAKDRAPPKDTAPCPWSATKPKAQHAVHNNNTHRDWTWNSDWRKEKRHGDVE
jgi:hypothetical protein